MSNTEFHLNEDEIASLIQMHSIALGGAARNKDHTAMDTHVRRIAELSNMLSMLGKR